MRILLQNFVPYPESFKWRIHHEYYQRRGAKAWLNREVPYQITSNSQAAQQHVKILRAILSARTSREPITILEVGAGLGAFAIRFLAIFEELYAQEAYPLSFRYLFSDFSKNSLEEASKNETLQKYAQQGILEFCYLDALQPETFQSLSGNTTTLATKSLTLVIENYLHCALPLTILRKENEQFLEKYLALYWKSDPPLQTENLMETLLQQVTQSNFLDQIEEESRYHPLGLSSFEKDPYLLETLREGTKEFEQAQVIFPLGSFEHLKQFLPFLQSDGALLISDKGYAEASWMRGLQEKYTEPSLHGNSLGHPVNFPLLERYARQYGYRTKRTTNRKFFLQTMAIFPETASLAGEEMFMDQFITQNPNQEAEIHWLKASEYKQKRQYVEAKLELLKCLEYRQKDCCLFYELGECSLLAEHYQDALKYFEAGRSFNYFQEHDFFFSAGKAWLGLKEYSKAIDDFQTSMQHFPSYPYSCYNIALAYEGQKKYWQAIQFYGKSLHPPASYPYKKAPPDVQGLVFRKRFFFFGTLPCFCLFFILLIALFFWILWHYCGGTHLWFPS